MNKKQLINEIMGVPKAIDPWVNYISSITVLLIDDIIEFDEWESKDIEYDGEEYPIHKSGIDLEGKEFTNMLTDSMFGGDIKKLLNSQEFKDFPLYNPRITIELLILPDVIYDEQRNNADRMEANHGYDGNLVDVKIGKLGKHEIFSKNNFTFKAIIPASYISDRTEQHENTLFNSLIPTVSHELTHSYQTYKQMLGGKKSVGFGKETILNMLPQELKFNETPSWNHFLHLIYLSLSFEVNARVTELYYSLKRNNVNTNSEALKILMDSDPWDDYKQLKNFDADKFIKEFDADIPQIDPMEEMMRALMGERPNTPTNNDELMKNLIVKWDTLIQHAQEHIKSLGIDIPFMEKVPQSAKDNPMMFFKFFEKRFHNKAEQLKRKLAKVISLVVQESEDVLKEETFVNNPEHSVHDQFPLTPEGLKDYLNTQQTNIVNWVQEGIDENGQENIQWELDIKQWINDFAGEVTPGKFLGIAYKNPKFRDAYNEFVSSTYDQFFGDVNFLEQ